MKFPSFIAVPALLASCLGAMAGEIRFERIDLTRSASGDCLVPVTVDGNDARFIVDSGAGTVIVLGKTALAERRHADSFHRRHPPRQDPQLPCRYRCRSI